MQRHQHCSTLVRLGFAAFAISASLGRAAHAKPFMDYVKKMPIVAPLSSATWGVAGVLPRDLSNGIESVNGAGVHPEYYYWDGQIIKAKDGKYHLFMSTFSGNTNFGTSWFDSDAYHAVSETNVLGPYVRKGFIYDEGGSHKGHNVTALELASGVKPIAPPKPSTPPKLRLTTPAGCPRTRTAPPESPTATAIRAAAMHGKASPSTAGSWTYGPFSTTTAVR